ncbi:mitochondrial peripheral inner membrane protein [Orbilia ellipsospora]|uniref:Mitochondrial peripheral inner membrane protein n=1 Tax=Orbilia ellipsospora TaxID=2528407 RepID=A0AAV9XJ62_9PEZI
MLQRPILRCNSHLSISRCKLTTFCGSLPSRPLKYAAPIRHFSSTSPSPNKSRPFYSSPFFAIPTAFLLGYITYTYTTKPPSLPINPYTFTPYTITSTIPLSPTSSIITLLPKRSSPPPPHFWSTISAAGLWSIQIKQPQLQIQREYTPLPAITTLTDNSPHQQDPKDENQLDIFIRGVNGGELSNYLLSLKAGDVVEVRGPVITYTWTPEPPLQTPQEVNVKDSEGDVRNAVFIAGGTGISPAIQLAQHLLTRHHTDGKKRQLTILFASRSSTETVLPHLKALENLKQAGGVDVHIKYFYDNKGSFINKSEVESAIGGLISASKDGSSTAGKDVILVSGPEGFVTHFAGKKEWKDGMETQGVLGGIVGEVLRGRKQGGKIEVMKL